jgi:hypothetical protein
MLHALGPPSPADFETSVIENARGYWCTVVHMEESFCDFPGEYMVT